MTTQLLLPPGSPPLPEPQHFAASDGYQLAYRLWQPSGSSRGLILALHGIQSHSGWYGWSSAKLAEAGYTVAFLDRRGSGANSAARGDAPHADRLLNDVVQWVAHLERIVGKGRGEPRPLPATSSSLDQRENDRSAAVAGLPIRLLMGISWGGKLAVTLAARRPQLFNALALLTPGLCARVRANALQRAALRIAHRFGAARRELPIPLDDPALFTDSPAHQEFIRRDPFALRRVSVRFLMASLRLDDEVRRNAAAIGCPTLLMLAGRDSIIDNAATQRRFETFGTPEKTLVEYPAARHTLEFEPDRERVVTDLIDWLNQRISRGH